MQISLRFATNERANSHPMVVKKSSWFFQILVCLIADVHTK
jgi:hypothetical protein